LRGRRLTATHCLILTAMIISSLLPAASCVPVQYPVRETYYEPGLITDNRTETYEETVAVVKTVSGEDLLTPYIVWSNPSLKFINNRFIWYYGYRLPGTISRAKEKIRITLLKQDYYEYSMISLFDMAPRGQVLQPPVIAPSDPLQAPTVQWLWISKEGDTSAINNWLNTANIKFNFARFLGGQSDLWMNRGSAYSIEFDTRGARDIAVVIAAPTTAQNARFTASWIWTDNVTEYVTRAMQRQVPYQVERTIERQRTVYKTRQAPFWEALLNRQ
jgi:hypothetical protein